MMACSGTCYTGGGTLCAECTAKLLDAVKKNK